MKFMTLLLSFLITTLITLTAYAGGDKVRANSQILEPGDAPCVYLVPPGIDLTEDCEQLTAPDQSGRAVFSCPSEPDIVICVEEESDNPGNSGSSSGKN